MEKVCCVKCFSNDDIRKFIEPGATIGNCDYCGSKNVYVCDVHEVGGFVMEGIERHYEEAAMRVGYCSSEGYFLPTVTLSEILLDEQDIFGEDLDDSDRLCDDLVSDDGTPYVNKDPYGPPPGEPEEIGHWADFRKVVKNQTRFTIFMQPPETEEFLSRSPASFLIRIAREFMPSLIRILPVSTSIFRARIRKDRPFEHMDLTSPPAEKTRNNRMSPAGISYFYGAMDEDTCVHEMRPDINEIVEIGEFKVMKNMPVLDLSSEPEYCGSIFNPEYVYHEEEIYKPFLDHFVEDISKPIRKTDAEIEYTPTQVLTEFIRTTNFKKGFFYPDSRGGEQDVFVNGTMYRSSVRKGGKNIVLFRGPDISSDTETEAENRWLYYKGKVIRQVTEIEVRSSTISEEDLQDAD
jgi:hypothetical protein